MDCREVAYEVFWDEQQAKRLEAEQAEEERLAALQSAFTKGDKNQKQPTRSKRRTRAQSVFVTSATRSEEPEEEMPDWVGRKVLYDYVVSMQKSFILRLKEWEEKMRQASAHLEVEQFAGTEGGEAEIEVHELKRHKPRKIYVDANEILAVIKNHLVIWHAGGYAHLKKNRIRLLEYGWKAFAGQGTVSAKRPSAKSNVSVKAAPKRKKKVEHSDPSADGEDAEEETCVLPQPAVCNPDLKLEEEEEMEVPKSAMKQTIENHLRERMSLAIKETFLTSQIS